MNQHRIDIIVPTWNNYEQLTQMVSSVLRYNLLYPVRIIVVNNGEPEVTNQPFFQHPNIHVICNGENLGWEGGLIKGLEVSDSEFVMFANDDIYIPEGSKLWLSQLLQPFHDKTVGAVGPATNVAMGQQNIFSVRHNQSWKGWYEVPFLIGYCMLLRRSALDAAGGVDDSLPGGDDLDLSIRLQDAGYRTVLDASTFVWHHGFQTGTRVFGDQTRPGGWNSPEMSEKTNMALIRKHGLRRWYNCLYGGASVAPYDAGDVEGDIIREALSGHARVVEVGVGGKKTVPQAIGVDTIPAGEVIPTLGQANVSVADVVADVSQPLPFDSNEFDALVARHILEHCQDTVATLREWSRVIRPGGVIAVAVPDQTNAHSIPMNPEHVHSFTPESLTNLAQLLGLRARDVRQSENGVSFVAILEKETV